MSACIHCGQPGQRICDACFEIKCDTVEANRSRFKRLVAAGVDRRMANKIMIARIEGGPPS